MITSHFRGHKIFYKNKVWYYADNGEKSGFQNIRPCNKCGKVSAIKTPWLRNCSNNR